MGTVVNLFPAPAALNSRGRAIGAHGNRATPAVQMRACMELELIAEAPEFQVSEADVAAQARATGVTSRTVWRWWKAHRATLAAQHLLGARDEVERDLLYRMSTGVRPRLELSVEDLKEIYGYRSVAHALRAFHADPSHRFSRTPSSTLNDAIQRVSPAVRASVRDSFAAGRAQEVHLPRTRCLLNDRWSADAYELKVEVEHQGETLRPKLLVIREDGPSGLPLAHVVVPHAFTAEDVRRCFGQAVVGWEYDGVQVSGAPRLFWSDQGSDLIARSVVTRIAAVGTVSHPTESHSPSANGAHEEMHRVLADFLWDLPGHQRARLKRNGERDLPGGAMTLAELLVVVDEAIDELRFNRPFLDGKHKGRTRFDVYKELRKAGQSRHLAVSDAQIAQVAVPVDTRKHSPKRGITFGKRVYTSVETAAYGGTEVMTVSTLLDPSTIWVHNAAGKFVGPAFDTEGMDPAEYRQIYNDRRARQLLASEIAAGAKKRRKKRGLERVAEVRDTARERSLPAWSDPTVPAAKSAALPGGDGSASSRTDTSRLAGLLGASDPEETP